MNDLLAIAQGIPVTLLLWIGAQALGAVVAVPVAAARMHRSRWLRLPATAWIETLRGIPTLVWLFVVYFGIVAAGFTLTAIAAAILALGLVSSAYVAETYRAGFEAVPVQQREAAAALGLPRLVTLRRVQLPQALPVILEGTGSYSIHLLKETALASLIGVVDVMMIASYRVERGADGTIVFLATGAVYLVGALLLAWSAHALGSRFAFRPASAR